MSQYFACWGQRELPLVYAELRRLASSYMRRERQDHTLQPTALINKAYLRFAKGNVIVTTGEGSGDKIFGGLSGGRSLPFWRLVRDR